MGPWRLPIHFPFMLLFLFIPGSAIPEPGSSIHKPEPAILPPAHNRTVYNVAWSPDGKIIASSSWDTTVKLWRVRDGKLLRTLKGHKGYVSQAAWSPDGRLIASAGNKTVKLWRAHDGKLLRTLKGHTHNDVERIAWSPDGRYITSTGWEIILWRVADGKPLHIFDEKIGHISWHPDGKTFAAHTYLSMGKNTSRLPVIKLLRAHDLKTLQVYKGSEWGAWSPDGHTFATTYKNKYVRIRRASDGKLIHNLKARTRGIFYVCWRPDGKVIASSSGKKVIQLWRVRDGKLLRALRGLDGINWGPRGDKLLWSPNGRNIAVVWRKTVKIWRASDGKILHTLKGHTRNMASAGWSPDGGMIATGSHDTTLKIWRTRDGKLLHSMKGYPQSQDGIVWNPNGKSFTVISSWDPDLLSIHFWHFAKRKLVNLMNETYQGRARSPNGRVFATAPLDQRDIKLWRISDGKLLSRISGVKRRIYDLAWRPDGKAIASASWGTGVEIWRVRDGKLLRRLKHDRASWQVTWGSDGKTVLTHAYDHKYLLWRVADGKRLREFPKTSSIVWRPDGKVIAVLSGKGTKTLTLIETGNGRRLRAFQNISGVAWRRDGKIMATVGAKPNWTVTLRRVRDGRILRRFQGRLKGANIIKAISWLPGEKIIAVHTNKGLTLFRVADGKQIGSIPKTLNWSSSPDGGIITSVSPHTKTIQMWRTHDVKLLRTLKGHTRRAWGTVWRRDGRILASVSADGTIKFWRARDGKLLATLLMFSDGIGVVHAPDGRFDYSRPAGKKYIAFRIAGKLVGERRLRHLHDRFYTPGLLGKLLR